MRIGHASIDENGKAKGGQAGDQTLKEVCIREWYSKPWDFVLRCIDSQKAELMAQACEEACANNNVGYDQNQRNSLRTQAIACHYKIKSITVKCECDCSSLMTVCVECAGISVPYNGSNAPTTSTMKDAFMKTGYFECLTDKKYTTQSAYLKRGDILVKAGSHTVMVLDNGSNAVVTSSPTITQAQTQINCIDISKYNVITDYKQMAKEVSNVIIRIGYRSYEKGLITEDPSFQKHIANCLGYGMNIGIYFYDQSINEQEAIEQAEWLLKKIKGYTIKLPVFIDSEYSNEDHNGRADNISASQRTKNIIAFCNTIKNAGYVAGVYSSDSFYKNSNWIDYSKLKNNYLIWCARYNTIPPTIDKYDIWQNGSNMFSWANGAIDTNIIYNIKQNTVITTSEKSNETPICVLGRITAGSLNVRSIPSTAGIVIKTYKKGTIVPLSAYVNTGWYKCGNDEYISAQYVEYVKAKVSNCSALNVRSSASSKSSSNIIMAVKAGTTATVMNHTNGWYQLLFTDNTIGWCSEKYITEF